MRFVNDVRELLEKREWKNRTNLRKRISGERSFPIRYSLKPPTGIEAGDSPDNFLRFQKDWKSFPYGAVTWEKRNFRTIGAQDVPVSVQIDRFSCMVDFLGPEQQAEASRWAQIISSADKWHPGARDTLTRFLPFSEDWILPLVSKAISVADQMSMGILEGEFLRSGSFKGVDTKFVESNEKLLTVLCECKWGSQVSDMGLLGWLGAQRKPEINLIVRMSRDLADCYGGLQYFKADWQCLSTLKLQGVATVLIVENSESVFVPRMSPGMVIVGGGGRNLAWMKSCEWLKQAKRVGYWGDMDMHGLELLDLAYKFDSRVRPLLMSAKLLHEFRDKAVLDPTGHSYDVGFPCVDVQECLRAIQQPDGSCLRLEQERLPGDLIADELDNWITG